MNKLAFSSMENHPDNDVNVAELQEKQPAEKVMAKPLINAKREARAQALYVLFNRYKESR
ncbi:hypothetical protein [Thalassomonas actiniarum]|uniref:Uncharacterized protein n=1 Tax=Thalassomonas actiniarum TaxID=485447 RepID=A0AAE9YX14_9GAMM|nr:hypothetical protein [Thalassomonas actiniarum]WDE02448.1 hypothetical protein SG35_028990 [Thalassomonas actiniarum]